MIPHGVDPRVFAAGNRPSDDGRRRIAFVGSLGKHKGVDLLPEILERVQRRIDNVELLVVGDGALAEALRDSLVSRNLTHNARLSGTLEPSEVRRILQQADVFLFPTQIEGFGLAIVEAMMCGAVPVLSQLDGVTDYIVEDGVTGILVSPRDVDRYASAICQLLDNPKRLSAMSLAAQSHARERFGLAQMMDRYIELFGEADDRASTMPASYFSWYAETCLEILRCDISRHRDVKTVFNRIRNVKRSLSGHVVNAE
jgi:glycosyltransferase involved in cell wall biosynthesis